MSRFRQAGPPLRKLLPSMLVVGVIAVFLLTPGVAHTAPGNDNWASRTTLSPDHGDLSAQTTVGATGETNEPGGSNPLTTVWYQWTPSTGGTAAVGTCSTLTDTYLGVYTGTTLAALVPVATSPNDDGCGSSGQGSQIVFTASGGTPYSIQVDGYSTGSAPFTVSWLLGSTPSNDNHRGTTLPANGQGSTTGSNLAATGESQERTNLGSSTVVSLKRSVWYSWTATGA